MTILGYYVFGCLVCLLVAFGPFGIWQTCNRKLSPDDRVSLLVLTGISLPIGAAAWVVLSVVCAIAIFC